MTDVATGAPPRPARLRDPRYALPVAVPLLVLALALVVHAYGGVHIDLETYRYGVRALLDGGDPYGELPPTAIGVVLKFIYPPFAALVLAPLALVPWEVAWPSVLGLSTLAIGATLHVTARRLWPSGGRSGALSVAALALPLSYALEPVRANARFGQVNALLMVLVAVDCLAARPRWPRGMLVGLAAAIKLTPAAFVLFFLLRGDRRAAAVAVLSGAAATLFAFALAPAASWRFWLDNPAGSVSGTPFFDNQSLQAVLVRAGAEGLERTVVWLVLAALLLALAAPVVRREPAPLALVTLAAVALLASPTSWSHHWVWVAPAMLVAVVTACRARSAGWALAAASMAAVFVGAPHTYGLPNGELRELAWTPLEQVQGATFVWFTMLLLVAAHLVSRRRAAA